jgi:hypothetical protein
METTISNAKPEMEKIPAVTPLFTAEDFPTPCTCGWKGRAPAGMLHIFDGHDECCCVIQAQRIANAKVKPLQAEIERLRANAKRFEKQALACGDENERLRAKLEDYQERTHTCSQKCKNAACVNRKLRVRVAELEEAVGPGIPIIHGAEELRAHDERITKPLRETLQSILDDCDKVYGPNLALFREYVITKARTALKGFEDSKVSPSDPQSAEKGEG